MEQKLIKHELGFLQVDPLPTVSELNEYYSKLYYQESLSSTYQSDYNEEELSYIKSKISQKAFAINQHKSVEIGRLLDVGCGEGFVMRHYFDKKWAVNGIDFSEYGITSFNPDLLKFFEKGDIYSILETKIENSEKFDIIWMGNVLEHVIDPIHLLKRLKLLLNSNGTLVITVPNDGSSFQELLLNKKYVNRNSWIAYPDHLSYFSYQNLIKIAHYTGYDWFELVADFPIDFFLLHSGSNYVINSDLGKEAHKARIEMENFIADAPFEVVNAFYANLAKLGLGRDLTIFLTPSEINQ